MQTAAEENASRKSGVASESFEPSADFASRAYLTTRREYEEMYRASIEEPESFWREQAKNFFWFTQPTKISKAKWIGARWFEDGSTNLAFNCVDRHVQNGRGDKLALVWEGEPGEVRALSYKELHAQTCRLANALRALHVEPGERVAIYMGMVPEAVMAMLACAHIGAVHTVIFGGFAADALADRVQDAQARVIITQDGAWRRGKIIPLKNEVDQALKRCKFVEHVLVLKRCENNVVMHKQRDLWWHEALQHADANADAIQVHSEHPLFILYTSGTTGKPKGILHTTGGYMVGVGLSAKYALDLHESDVHWCTADIGWVTGHSYVVYGPLLNHATVFLYEGAPDFPDKGRFWSMIDRHRITILYTAPTAIRSFLKWGRQWPDQHDLSSLRLLGSVGEPINPEVWRWYYEVIGAKRCPVIDTWWQTETGAIMLTPLPGAVAAKPGSCALPFFGVKPKVVREDGSDAAPNESGLLVIEKPWPSMLRTVWEDEARFAETYFSRFPGVYFTGDGARCDKDGYFWVSGRVDDVVKVSGHRLGTAEVESALVSHPAVAEAAVVGRADEIKGQALVAFVTLKQGIEADDALKQELIAHVARELGKFAQPDQINCTDALPKTRSGKIMRRLLRKIAEGKSDLGDTSTLEDEAALEKLQEQGSDT